MRFAKLMFAFIRSNPAFRLVSLEREGIVYLLDGCLVGLQTNIQKWIKKHKVIIVREIKLVKKQSALDEMSKNES